MPELSHYIKCSLIYTRDNVMFLSVGKTPDDGRLRPKNVVRRRNKSGNSCIEDNLLCVKDI
jgi:hypothetical protein